MAPPRTSPAGPAKPRLFKLREPAEGAKQPVIRVCVGHNPRVSIGTGESFSTVDQALAERLASDPLLQEVKS